MEAPEVGQPEDAEEESKPLGKWWPGAGYGALAGFFTSLMPLLIFISSWDAPSFGLVLIRPVVLTGLVLGLIGGTLGSIWAPYMEKGSGTLFSAVILGGLFGLINLGGWVLVLMGLSMWR